jgi:hypothetical protein
MSVGQPGLPNRLQYNKITESNKQLVGLSKLNLATELSSNLMNFRPTTRQWILHGLYKYLKVIRCLWHFTNVGNLAVLGLTCWRTPILTKAFSDDSLHNSARQIWTPAALFIKIIISLITGVLLAWMQNWRLLKEGSAP